MLTGLRVEPLGVNLLALSPKLGLGTHPPSADSASPHGL
jgi:hypothetical protein